MEKPHQLNYRPIPPRAGAQARLFRAAMLTVAILAFQLTAILTLNPVFRIWQAQGWLGGGAMGTPVSPINQSLSDEQNCDAYAPRAFAYLAVFLLSQWLFLMPRGSWRIGMPSDDPPPKRSAIAAGLIGMLLSIGLLATLMEIPDWWLRLTTEGGIKTTQHFGIVWIIMAALWAFWAFVFYSYMRTRDRLTALQKIFRWLLAGTIVEMVIAVPVHAIILRERGADCYCERGTWTGVAFGCTAALWLFGPGVFLLFLRERKRREEFL